MYTPAHFREARLPVLHSWMRENSFATFVSVIDGAPFATHLPALLDSSRGQFGTIRAHMARANPHWRAFESGAELLVIYQGPHGYITPSWYEASAAVPTWNYTAVHAYGVPRVLEGEAAMALLLDQVALFESGFEKPWDTSGQAPGYIETMAKGIVAFEVEVTLLEGKGKLSQNRPADREQVLDALEERGAPEDLALASVMRSVDDREQC